MKKVLALLIAMVFTVGVAGLAFAQDSKGTVTKIEAKKVTVKDEKGKETTVEVKEAGGAKVGDAVEIKGGVVKVLKKGKAPAYK